LFSRALLLVVVCFLAAPLLHAQGVADVSITKTDTVDPVGAGDLLGYSIVVSNANGTANGVTVADIVPANTTFMSFVAPAGWTVVTPAVGGTGAISATRAVMLPGESAAFVLLVRVNPGTPGGTVITNTAVAQTEVDSNRTNNTATAVTTVAAAEVGAVPTLSEYAMLVMVLGLALLGAFALTR
jgi:uncharacterized repeat protein (TIGR01451 family)